MESPHVHPVLTPPASRGFTLVEMVVVMAIIGIITSIALIGQQSFSRTVLLTDTAYTVALSVREAQSLGLSSRTFNSYENAGYGVYFSTGSPTTYKIFADVVNSGIAPTTCPAGQGGPIGANPGNCLYDTANGSTEQVQGFAFSQGFTVTDFCGLDDTSTTVCATSGDVNRRMSSIHIVFTRPNTEAIITGVLINSSLVELSNATIYITEPKSGNQRCVQVSQVGQVSVLQTCP